MQPGQMFCRAGGKSETFIFKPDNGCQGKGICLFKGSKPPKQAGQQGVVQRYLRRPYLIDGYKADFRIYVLVTACEPTFRIFIYEDGLVRLATTKYKPPTSKNLGEVFCHLTNYSINKNSEAFDEADGDGEGSKRKLSWMRVRSVVVVILVVAVVVVVVVVVVLVLVLVLDVAAVWYWYCYCFGVSVRACVCACVHSCVCKKYTVMRRSILMLWFGAGSSFCSRPLVFCASIHALATGRGS
jgi:hypothetical protein